MALLDTGGSGKPTPSPAPAADSSPATAASMPSAAARSAAVEVLHRWDLARATAWASGDAGGLRELYVVQSRAGAADVALLRRYLRRGLVVAGMRRQVVAVEVVSASPRLLRLRVTDRLVRAVARSVTEPSAGGRALPTSRAVARTVALRRAGGGGPWRMASVRLAPARTSG